MTGAIRAEFLRAVSGWTVLAVVGLTVLVPVMVLTSSGDPAQIARDLSSRAATQLLLAPLAWSFVAAGFAGAYSVTREQYYGSLDRTLLLLGRARAQLAKTVAGCLVGALFTIVLCIAWCGAIAMILAVNGNTFTLSGAAVEVIAWSLVGALLGAAGGCAIGWIVRNYYATAAIVLAGPLAVELVVLGQNPEVARFLPGLTIAAIAAPGYRDALLERPLALVLATTWVAAVSVAAVVLTRRRA